MWDGLPIVKFQQYRSTWLIHVICVGRDGETYQILATPTEHMVYDYSPNTVEC